MTGFDGSIIRICPRGGEIENADAVKIAVEIPDWRSRFIAQDYLQASLKILHHMTCARLHAPRLHFIPTGAKRNGES
jgi:hypothetical protein